MWFNYLSDNLFQALHANFQPVNLNFPLLLKPALKSSRWILVKETISFFFDYSFFQSLYYKSASLTVSCRFTGKICFIRFTDNFLVKLEVTVIRLYFFWQLSWKCASAAGTSTPFTFRHTETYPICYMSSAMAAIFFSNLSVCVAMNQNFYQLFLFCSIFLDFHPIPTAKKRIVFG